MSSQMVDSYLDELLAPLTEHAMAAMAGAMDVGGMAGIALDGADAAANSADATDVAEAGREVHLDIDTDIDLGSRADSSVPLPVPATSPVAEVALEPTPARPPPAASYAPIPPVAEPVAPAPMLARPPAAIPSMPLQRQEPAPAHRPSQGSTTGNRWLRAMLGTDRYAFELLRVQEVVRTTPIIALRGTSSAMLGVMNLRGRIVPVFDLALWLGTGRVEVDEHARIIVVERDDELIGVLVSAVDDVVTLAREHIEPPLPGSDPGGVVGIARVSRAPTVLLDANALFA